MEHIPFSKRVTHENSESCIVNEYPTESTELDMATADIDGRYPTTGYAVNRESVMAVYVHSKFGKVLFFPPDPETGNDSFDVSNGHQVIIPRNQPYALMGKMGLIIASTPKWSPDQAEIIELALDVSKTSES